MSCSSCGGQHIGQCPGVRRICGECNEPFIAGNGWHNHSLCSYGCCADRRRKLAPPDDEDDYPY